MIVNWEKYSNNSKSSSNYTNSKLNETKNSKKSHNSNKAYQDSSNQLLGLQCEISLNEELDDEREHSITSPTSIAIEPKNLMNLTEANISVICPFDSNNNIGSLLFQMNDLSFNIFSAKQQTFEEMISNSKSFATLMNQYNAYPKQFYSQYKDDILIYSNLMVYSSYSHLLLIQLFSYFNAEEKEYFFTLVIQDNLDSIIRDDYGVEVLLNFIFWLLNKEDSITILFNMLNLIQSHFVNIVLIPNGIKLIRALINQKDNNVMNMIYASIVTNTIKISLTAGGLSVIQYFIQYTPFGKAIIEIILNHLNILLVHSNGNLIIQYLIDLNINHLSSIIINHLTSNFIFYSNDQYTSLIIEDCLLKCNKSLLLPFVNIILYSQGLVNQLLLTEKGIKIFNLINEISPFMTQEYLLSQLQLKYQIEQEKYNK